MSDENLVEDRVDTILEYLTTSKAARIRISTADISYLIHSTKQILLDEPSVLELKPPINVCGDIHGQFTDLLRLFKMEEPLPQSNYLFLGDYVDRGPQGLEVMCLLLAYKLKFPNSIYLLRGNHECREMTELYGFGHECITKQNRRIYSEFCDLFNTLPIAAIIANRIFCVHGGLSPLLENLNQIKQFKRPMEIPENGLMADLLWSDPERLPGNKEWGPSERGMTCVWSLIPAKRFLEKNHFSVLIRAHQLAMEGIEFPFAPNRSVITVFSAPNYAGEFTNRGAFLKIDKQLVITSAILPKAPKIVPKQGRSSVGIAARPVSTPAAAKRTKSSPPRPPGYTPKGTGRPSSVTLKRSASAKGPK